MAVPTIQPAQIKTGPGIIYYKAAITAMPTAPTAAGSKVVFNWVTDTWLQVGATDSGMTYTESTSSEDIRVAESVYKVKSVVTEKSGAVAFAMNHLSDLNWKLAMNGGTITVTGTGATKLSAYVPPLAGAEERISLGFHSYDEEEMIIWPLCFNTGSVETARSGFADKAGLPVEFSVELPAATVLAQPYKRWTAGGLAQGT